MGHLVELYHLLELLEVASTTLINLNLNNVQHDACTTLHTHPNTDTHTHTLAFTVAYLMFDVHPC